jgi:hypothetical protein
MEDNRAKIFRELKKLMKKYERPFITKINDDKHYEKELISFLNK